MERTLILFKPDCVERRLVGRILSRFEDKGFGLVAMKLLRITPELAKQHYAEHVEKPFYPSLEKFITASPVVAAVLEGPEVIRVVRDMLGPTNGLNAPAGTIRGDFGSSRQMNLVHASDGPEAAKREIEIYFRADEIHSWTPTLAPWLQAEDEKYRTGGAARFGAVGRRVWACAWKHQAWAVGDGACIARIFRHRLRSARF